VTPLKKSVEYISFFSQKLLFYTSTFFSMADPSKFFSLQGDFVRWLCPLGSPWVPSLSPYGLRPSGLLILSLLPPPLLVTTFEGC